MSRPLPPAQRALAAANAIMVLDESMLCHNNEHRWLIRVGGLEDSTLKTFTYFIRAWRLARAAKLELRRREEFER